MNWSVMCQAINTVVVHSGEMIVWNLGSYRSFVLSIQLMQQEAIEERKRRFI